MLALAKDCPKCLGKGRNVKPDIIRDKITYCDCELGKLLEVAEGGKWGSEKSRLATVDERIGAAYDAVTHWAFPIDKILLPTDIGGRDPVAELRKAVEKYREADLFRQAKGSVQ